VKGICILGSTGSIGVSSLDVIRLNSDLYRVIALTANENIEKLFQQCIEFQPEYAVLVGEENSKLLRDKLKAAGYPKINVISGTESLENVAKLSQVDYVIAAIVGAAGLLPTLSAAKAGKRVLLANKEALVMSGDIFMATVKNHHAELLPLDSEHNAIFQCMPPNYKVTEQAAGIRKIILTASGGPFLNKKLADLEKVTPQQACAHPNWSMGKKISVDSATLMNKGLEVIEASYLFDLPVEKIDVVIHPQSIVHSMVDYLDGSVLAQMGNPDMRTPIAQALAWPARHASGVSPLDFMVNNKLTFEQPDFNNFPCLRFAFDALKVKGTAPAILNAANEVAVDAFLEQRIKFMDIPRVIDKVLNYFPVEGVESIDAVLSADTKARQYAMKTIRELQA